jgi:hypothetical protein
VAPLREKRAFEKEWALQAEYAKPLTNALVNMVTG